MLWPSLILAVFAAALAGLGIFVTARPSSADERVGGAWLILAAIVTGVLAALWWIIAVTWMAFS